MWAVAPLLAPSSSSSWRRGLPRRSRGPNVTRLPRGSSSSLARRPARSQETRAIREPLRESPPSGLPSATRWRRCDLHPHPRWRRPSSSCRGPSRWGCFLPTKEATARGTAMPRHGRGRKRGSPPPHQSPRGERLGSVARGMGSGGQPCHRRERDRQRERERESERKGNRRARCEDLRASRSANRRLGHQPPTPIDLTGVWAIMSTGSARGGHSLFDWGMDDRAPAFEGSMGVGQLLLAVHRDTSGRLPPMDAAPSVLELLDLTHLPGQRGRQRKRDQTAQARGSTRGCSRQAEGQAGWVGAWHD